MGAEQYGPEYFFIFIVRGQHGISNRTRWLNTKKFGKSDSIALWTIQNSAEIEYLSASFKPIQQYRAVEFDRDWNTRNKGYEGYQLIGTLGSKLSHKKFGLMALDCLLYTSPSPRDATLSRMPSSA